MAQEHSDTSSVVPGDVFVAGAAKYPDDISLVAAEGEGPYLKTEDGTEYVDYVLGGGPLLVGHSHPRVVEAMEDQLERGATFYVPSEEGYSLAKRVVDAVPCADMLKFSSTGSEATYQAMRLARAHTGREKVLKFGGAYHGFHDYAMRSCSYADKQELLERGYPEGTIDSAGMTSGAAESVLVSRYNDLEMTAEIMRENADDLAAVIVEPIMRTLPPVDGFLSGLRDLCDELGVVLIADEVVTGFRMGWGGGQERYGFEADLATYGKAIGGGTPVAAVCGRREIMEFSDPNVPTSEGGAYISGTLSGNPLGMVAGHALLDVLEQSGTYRHLDEYGDDLRAIIIDVIEDTSLSVVTLGDGPLVDYALTDEPVQYWEDVITADGETKQAIDRELLERGVLQLHGSKRYISTEHGPRELERTAEAYKEAVEAVTS